MWKSGFFACAAEIRKEQAGQTCFVPPEFQKQLDAQAAKIAMLTTELKRASVSLAAFCGDEGWSQSDMDTMDSVDAALSATEQDVAKFIAEIRKERAAKIALLSTLIATSFRDCEDGTFSIDGTDLEAIQGALRAAMGDSDA